MAGNHQFPQRKKNALDHAKLKLSTPCPSAQGKWSTFGWGITGNNPRITVYTNDPNDSKNDNGRITGPMGSPDLFAIMHFLQVAVDAPGKCRNKVALKNFIFPGGRRSEKPVVVAELWIGQDDEGVIWMSLCSPDSSRPKIKFPIGPGDFANWFKEDGSEYSKGEISKIYAAGYMELIKNVMEQLIVTEYKEPEPKDGQQRNNNQQQNNNQGQQRNQGSSPAAETFDDDIPF